MQAMGIKIAAPSQRCIQHIIARSSPYRIVGISSSGALVPGWVGTGGALAGPLAWAEDGPCGGTQRQRWGVGGKAMIGLPVGELALVVEPLDVGTDGRADAATADTVSTEAA